MGVGLLSELLGLLLNVIKLTLENSCRGSVPLKSDHKLENIKMEPSSSLNCPKTICICSEVIEIQVNISATFNFGVTLGSRCFVSIYQVCDTGYQLW